MIGAVNRLGVEVRRGLSQFAVGSKEPSLGFDFIDNTYLADGTKNLSQALTHSRSGNATMTDSDGNIKWAPHNLLKYSEDFTGSGWTGTVDIEGGYEAPNGELTASKVTVDASTTLTQTAVGVIAPFLTFSVYVKEGNSSATRLVIRDKTAGSNLYIANFEWSTHTFSFVSATATEYGNSVEDVGNGWYKISIYCNDHGNSNDARCYIYPNSNTGQVGDYVYIWGAHAYRSDLGGMVDNPERGDSYVPTTASASYLPRVGHHVYNGDAWVNEGLLHESESRTNLVTYSEDFTHGSWTKIGVTVTANAAVAPDGTLTMDSITNPGSGYMQDTVTVGSLISHTFSVYAKKDSTTSLKVQGYDNAYWARATFNLTDGTISSVEDGAASIVDVGNGIYRCSVTGIPNNLNTTVFFVPQSTGVCYIWGAQLEEASTPSSYIPTAGATVTRAAETLTVPAANLPWPYPEVIGDELVTNGAEGFSGTTDWTSRNTAILSEVGGDLVVENGDALNGGAVFSFSSAVGTVYRVVGETGASTSTTVLRVGTTSGAQNILGETVSGSFDFVFVASGSTTYVTLHNGSSTLGDQGVYNNISVREINPLSVSIQMDGRMTYADTDILNEVILNRWEQDVNNSIRQILSTSGLATGAPTFRQAQAGTVSLSSAPSTYSPDILVPYNISSRHGSTFINGAVDGTALTANTTPVALPDLSSTDLSLGYDYMGTINQFRVWSQDLGDDGIVTATEPSLEPSLSLTFDGSESSFTVDDWT